MTYTVSFGRVQAVLANMESASRKIETMLRSLEQDSEKNLAEWRSEAQASYRECKLRWDASAARMPQILAQANLSLSEIMQNYRRTDQINASSFTGGR